jgi:aminopeptidase N
VLGYVRWTVADRYLPPGGRGAALADITSPCRELLSRYRVGDGGDIRLTATVQGFWQADQADLLAGYVRRYFAALAGAVAGGAADLARIWCLHGFPHHGLDAATVRVGERCLQTGGLAGSLRRLLADQLGDLRRSVAKDGSRRARAGGPRCA